MTRAINVETALPMQIQLRFYREPVEILRAALCTLTYRKLHYFEPAHVVRIKNCCERFGLSETVERYLNVLYLLREYEHLGSGYWAPTPQRLVKFPGCDIFIAPNTTAELERGYPGAVRVAGFGRVIDKASTVALPEQTVESWLGSPKNLMTWVQEQLKEAKKNLRPTVHPRGRVEIYRPWTYSPRLSWSVRKRWIALEELDFDVNSELLLCRIAGLKGAPWFFAVTKASRVVEECEVPGDQKLRLLYGLDAVHGISTEVQINNMGHLWRIKLDRPIPAEEKRVLLALAQIREENGVEYFDFDPRYFSAVEFAFNRLAIPLRGHA